MAKIAAGAVGGVVALALLFVFLPESEAPQDIAANSSAGTLAETGTLDGESLTPESSGSSTEQSSTDASANNSPQTPATQSVAATSNSGSPAVSSEATTTVVGLPSESPFQPVPDKSSATSSDVALSMNSRMSTGSPSSGPDLAKNSSGMAPSADVTTQAVRSATELSWADLNERVEPCVVRVDVKTRSGEGNGSGFVIAEKGLVVTNYHVVEGLTEAWLIFANKDRLPVTGLAFVDKDRDIAVVTFNPAGASVPLRALPLTTELPRKGEEVAAFGAPFGLDFTFTQSTVSANRTADDLKKIGADSNKGSWIQHSAPISPGSSGGPLVNKFGEVVAINTMILTIGQNLNFAISALDIGDAMTKLLPTPLPVTPSSAPEIASRSGRPSPRGGSGFTDRRKEAIDITGDPRATKLLAEMKDVSVLILTFSLDVRGTVTGAVRKSAYEAVERSKLKIGSFTDDRPLLLVGMALERSGMKSSLRVKSTLLMQDGNDIVKLWEETEDVGTISEQSLMIGRLPPNLRKDISDYFRKFRVTVSKARRDQETADKAAAAAKP